MKMEKKQKILELRQRLDSSLASPDLVNEESIKALVKDQLLSSFFVGNEGDLENIVARRTQEVSKFLEMLRSASGDKVDMLKTQGGQSDWKIKQDTDQLRVLYHEGPQGSPLHTLLAEGCADGPIDTCLCVSWETTLYKKWWPQYNIPTFKITTSTRLQKVRVGEEISLIRVKVPWPISDREALLHYFEIEFLKEDLILVLLNTISDTDHIDASSHGFTRDGFPEAEDTVRISLVGGFVIQRVDANKSYFRVIANMDIKLDFVPPSLINFISRQLIDSGHRLYKKVVSSVANGDDDYSEALKGPMYVRIRQGLNSHNNHKIVSALSTDEEHTSNSETAVENISPPPKRFVTEIVEVEVENSPQLEGSPSVVDSPTNAKHIIRKRSLISPDVEQALAILDRAIATIRGGGFSGMLSDCSLVDQEITSSDPVEATGHIHDELPPKNKISDKESDEEENQSPARDFRCNDDGSPPKESPPVVVNAVTVKLDISDDKLIAPMQPAFFDRVKVCDEESLQVNGFIDNGPYSGTNKPNRKKRHRFCCLVWASVETEETDKTFRLVKYTCM